jgi:hypothetical protein
MNAIDEIFTTDNTDGFTGTQLNKFNVSLAERLQGVEKFSEEYYQIIQAFPLQ